MTMTEQDTLRRFIFDNLGIRGEWVRLESSWQQAKQHQHLNATAQELLGQALVASLLLSATIKFKGSLIFQAQGNGPCRTLVAQATDSHQIRGLIRCSEELHPGNLNATFGEGYLVITIKSELAEPYQGIAPLSGDNLAAAVQTYFNQSEQLPTRLWLFANQTQAAGLFLQQLPQADNHDASADDWQKITLLADTVTAAEMFSLAPEELLHRLFHQEQLRLFEAEAINFGCSCSNPTIEQTLYTLGREELESILAQQDTIEVNCEFCNRHYLFDRVDIERILMTGIPSDTPTTTCH